MKRAFLALMIVAVAFPVFAGDRDGYGRGPGRMNPFAAERAAILREYADRRPSDLTFAEMAELNAALSVPMQKAAYVGASAFSSFLMPGMGQFKNDDYLSGALFMLADLAVVAGTATGIYFLLPPELRFDQLDYFNATKSEIETAWETAEANATFANSWPVMAVASGGMLLKHVVSYISARHAGRLAMERIQSGEVTFKPHAGFMMGPHGPGVGFGLRY